jgi:hypothetical protein
LDKCASCCEFSCACNENILSKLASMLAVLTVLPAAFYYVVEKFSQSLTNIVAGRKILRSLSRLAAIVVGGCAGTYIGMSIGITVGTLILPGLGTVAGFYIGGLVGGFITSAGAAILSKTIFKAISAVAVTLGWYGNAKIVSASNPTKYFLTTEQQQRMRAAQVGLASDDVIHKMLKDARKQKNRICSFTSYNVCGIYHSPSYKDKEDLNQLIDGIMNDPTVINEGACGTTRQRFFWRNNTWKRSDASAIALASRPITVRMVRR